MATHSNRRMMFLHLGRHKSFVLLVDCKPIGTSRRIRVRPRQPLREGATGLAATAGGDGGKSGGADLRAILDCERAQTDEPSEVTGLRSGRGAAYVAERTEGRLLSA
jgi:hypothetical protein